MSPEAGPSGHVLVVDELDARARLTTGLLGRAGFSADRADSQEDAMARLKLSSPPFDAVVSSLGGESTSPNVALLEAVRSNEDPTVAAVRFIVCAPVDTNRAFSWTAGADGFLVHPFHADDLVTEIRQALARSTEERAAHREAQASVLPG